VIAGSRKEAVLYARRSIEDRKRGRADRSPSLDSQLRACREFVGGEGVAVIGEFADDGMSGANWERPALWEAVEAAPPGGQFVFFDLDRFSRENELLWNAIRKLREKRVLPRTPRQDYPDSEEGDILLGIGGAMAAGERRKIARRIARWRVDYMRVGKHTGPAPYGYRLAGSGILAPDLEGAPAPAEVVPMMFQQALEGWGCGRIAVWLGEQHIPPPQASDGLWRISTVYEFVRRPLYAGYATRPVACEEPETWRDRWELNEGLHPPLVDRELFAVVQELLWKRRGRGQSANGYPFLLTGILRCPACGGPMKGSYQYRRSGRYPRYQCSQAVSVPGLCARGQAVGAKRVEEAFLRALAGDESARIVMREQVASDPEGALRQSLERERLDLARRQENLLRVIEQGAVEPEIMARLQGRWAELREHLAEVETRFATLGETRPIETAAAVIVTDTAAALMSSTVPPSQRRQILRRHIAALVLHEGETGEAGFDLTLRPVT